MVESLISEPESDESAQVDAPTKSSPAKSKSLRAFFKFLTRAHNRSIPLSASVYYKARFHLGYALSRF